MNDEIKPGALYVVATPIGHLGDLSPRALRILDGVDRVAAEDTRVSAALLGHFGVRKRMVSLHEHNEDETVPRVLEELAKGRSVALVSDAGTPLISDPGYGLVRAARAAGVPVLSVPGPCAAIAALSVSGLPSDEFLFAGFLPARAEARRHRLEALALETRTLILYESTHRIAETVQAVADVFGRTRRVCVARELTKLFEESHTAPAGELPAWLERHPERQRGEFVLVIEGAPAADAAPREARRVLQALLPELGASRAAKVAAVLTGQPRKELYALAVELGGAEGARRRE